MQLCFAAVLALCIFGAEIHAKAVSIKNPVDGYYWRDYTGYLPSDAVPGGKDDKGETTFIGIALHPGQHLTPGVIRNGDNKVYYEYGRAEHSATENVKILCSQHPEHLIWMKVETKHSIYNLNGNHLIIAGHDSAGPLAIGRKDKGNEVAVGKVLIRGGTEFGSIYTTKHGKGHEDGSYEVLVYNQSSATNPETMPNETDCCKHTININFSH